MALKNIIKKIFCKILYIKDEFIWALHISKVHARLNVRKADINKDLLLKHINYWNKLKPKVNPKWFEVYSSINNPDIQYVPENIYFNIIEVKLNNRKFAAAYADKNFYEIFYENKEIFPETIIRNIDGVFYNRDYKLLRMNEESLIQSLINYEKILIKPAVDSGGGKKIQLFIKDGDHFFNDQKQHLSLIFLKNNFNHNYIIQNYIRQNEYLAQFNPTSVNTVRIFTYRSVITDEVIPLHAVLRIGKKGNYIDDQNVGGVACRINDDSKLNDFATNYFGEKFLEFNGIVFSQVKQFPLLNEMKQITIQLAGKNIHSRVMGFDFTIDFEEKVKLVEINHLWTGINFFQMNSSPLFGKFTDEVVTFCINN